MPENKNKEGSKIENKPPQQGVSIKVKGQDSEQALRNQDQEILNKKEPKGKEEGRSGGGLVKGIVNFIKGIFTATIDMPQQGQPGSRENPNQQAIKAQTEWVSQAFSEKIEQGTKKNPEDLSPETKQKVEKAGKRLKEGLERSDAGDQPDKKHGKEHDNEEEITPGGRGV